MFVRWPLLLAVTIGAGAGLGGIGLPSPYLFSALLAGLVVALLRPGGPDVPAPVFTAAQAVLGVVLGLYLQASSLEAAADAWAPVLLVSTGTLVASLGVGLALVRWARADPPTAVLGMVAGGASGIVAMAHELGADDRLVAFMQYLRVLVVVLATPLIATLAFGVDGAASGVGSQYDFFADAGAWLAIAAIAPIGVLVGQAIRLPAGTLLGPLILAGALALTGPFAGMEVPGLLQEAAFIAIGLQVGLRFTPDAVREVGRLLLPVLLAIAGLMVICFGLAGVLTATTDVPLLDAYLATTPGGLYAVLAAAFGAGADTTFILAVQTLRLLVMVLIAPLLVRLIVRKFAG